MAGGRGCIAAAASWPGARGFAATVAPWPGARVAAATSGGRGARGRAAAAAASGGLGVLAAPPLHRGWPVPGRRRSLGWPGALAVLPPPLPLGRGLVAAAAVCDAARPGLPSAAAAASGGQGLLAVSPPPRVVGEGRLLSSDLGWV